MQGSMNIYPSMSGWPGRILVTIHTWLAGWRLRYPGVIVCKIYFLDKSSEEILACHENLFAYIPPYSMISLSMLESGIKN
jgi:hypothetical protein